jgi:hypothetical protein
VIRSPSIPQGTPPPARTLTPGPSPASGRGVNSLTLPASPS